MADTRVKRGRSQSGLSERAKNRRTLAPHDQNVSEVLRHDAQLRTSSLCPLGASVGTIPTHTPA